MFKSCWTRPVKTGLNYRVIEHFAIPKGNLHFNVLDYPDYKAMIEYCFYEHHCLLFYPQIL